MKLISKLERTHRNKRSNIPLENTILYYDSYKYISYKEDCFMNKGSREQNQWRRKRVNIFDVSLLTNYFNMFLISYEADLTL